MKRTIKHLAIAAASMAVAAQTASAAFTFTDGDVVLGFQTTGTGSNNNVFFNLGSGTNLRDGITTGVLGTISTTLTTAYGADWYTRNDIYFGAIGNLNFAPNSGFGSKAAVNGDPSATLYLSRAAGSSAYNLTASALRGAGSAFASQEANVLISLDSLALQADNSAILNLSTGSNAAINNSWTTYNPIGGVAYSNIAGGIQTTFGQGGSATSFDLQRIIPTTTGANPTQDPFIGNTIASIGIGSDGSITVVPEPSAAILSGIGALMLAFRRRRNA
jgi:hypothetical protein